MENNNITNFNDGSNPTQGPNVPPPPKPTKKPANKKARIIIIVLVSVLFVFGLLVLGHFLFKSCKNKKEGYYNVKVIQPQDTKYKLTVNGKEGSFDVEYGTPLTVIVKEQTQFNQQYANDYHISNANADTPVVYFAQVTDQKDPSKVWKSSQMYAQGDTLMTQFKMNWNYDIVIQIVSENNFDNFIYTKDTESGEITYTYDDSIYNSASNIFRVNAKTYALEEVERDKFNDPIWVGKKVEFLDNSFFSKCPKFNSPITFATDGALKVINNNFLWSCTSFNQEIVFPDSLHTVLGHFMWQCTSFNNGDDPLESNKPLNTNKISGFIAVNGDQGSFLKGCTSFNQTIEFGSELKWMPVNFLWDCKDYNRDITIPNNIEKMYDGFLLDCDNYSGKLIINCPTTAFDHLSSSLYFCAVQNSKAKCYKEGIKVSGSNKHSFVTTFGPLNTGLFNGEIKFYRNLIEA